MKKIHLVMPMGGAGSRFHDKGFDCPKPLIEICGKPFFYWAVLSITNYMDVADITFVVLQKHVDIYHIDNRITELFPNSIIKVIPEILPGPVLTSLEGLSDIIDDGIVIFNDCDHMFGCKQLADVVENDFMSEEGALLCFESDKPQYSYVRFDDKKSIIGTVEKRVDSNRAICGAYIFKTADLFRQSCEEYIQKCEYSELFMSGIYNIMCDKGMIVKSYLLDFHVEFGTPEEFDEAVDSKYFSEMQNLYKLRGQR